MAFTTSDICKVCLTTLSSSLHLSPLCFADHVRALYFHRFAFASSSLSLAWPSSSRPSVFSSSVVAVATSYVSSVLCHFRIYSFEFARPSISPWYVSFLLLLHLSLTPPSLPQDHSWLLVRTPFFNPYSSFLRSPPQPGYHPCFVHHTEVLAPNHLTPRPPVGLYAIAALS